VATSELQVARVSRHSSGRYSCRSLEDASDNDTVVLTVIDEQQRLYERAAMSILAVMPVQLGVMSKAQVFVLESYFSYDGESSERTGRVRVSGSSDQSQGHRSKRTKNAGGRYAFD